MFCYEVLVVERATGPIVVFFPKKNLKKTVEEGKNCLLRHMNTNSIRAERRGTNLTYKFDSIR